MSSMYTAETTTPEIQALFRAEYINLTTYRKDGTPMITPVWGSEERGTIYVETQATMGKVKRIKNEAHVTVSPCTARGVTTGQTVPAHARIVDEHAEELVAEGALQRKYGIKRQIVHMLGEFMRLFRRQPALQPAFIAIVPYNEHDHPEHHTQQ
jgi:PPOX class probable F420-dependent enzyme, Rv2061 family